MSHPEELILDHIIQFTVTIVEEIVERSYELKFKEVPKSPPIDTFKASMLAEIARRLKHLSG